MTIQRSFVLAAICICSIAALAVALTAQHAFGVKPCAWCVLQRGIFMLLAAVAFLGWLVRNRPLACRATSGLVAALSLTGIAAAWYQHDVASQHASCAIGFADRAISALNLEEAVPAVFMVTANCAEAAAYSLLGLGYEIWSGLLYLLFAAGAIAAMKKPLPHLA